VKHRTINRRARRLRRAAGGVGLCLSQAQAVHAARVAHLRALADELAGWIVDRQSSTAFETTCVLVTGPSGSGKSTFLWLLAGALRARGTARVSRLNPEGRLARSKLALASMDDGPLDAWLAHLGRFGLGEARLWLGPPAALSVGQRFRLALALAARSPTRSPARRSGRADERATRVLMVDEFAATLDRFTARSLAHSVGRLGPRGAGLCLVLATSHDDLLAALEPACLVRIGLDGRGHISVMVRRGLMGRGLAESA
jgi:ABC-type ATPase with predicted acetyltransferase domain